jgi:cyclopropane fatty-acyl-phospholipid synthase-like methyltransferase
MDRADQTPSYYDLATGLYEEAWCQSFHFCRFAAKEPFLQAIARHEHYLAARMDLKQGMRVLDVGCGVGGYVRRTLLLSFQTNTIATQLIPSGPQERFPSFQMSISQA